MIAGAGNWDARVAMIRRIPEAFGTAEHADVYAAIARHVYVPKLTPEFAYVDWRDEYELSALAARVRIGTREDPRISRRNSRAACAIDRRGAETLRIFRLLLGLTGAEFSEASLLVGEELNFLPFPRVRSRMEKSAGRISAGCSCDLHSRRSSFGRVRDAISKGKGHRCRARQNSKSRIPHAAGKAFLSSNQRRSLGWISSPTALWRAFRQLLDPTSGNRGAF